MKRADEVRELDALARRIRACRICADNPRGPAGVPLPHAPNPVLVPSATARIAICGQAPGNLVNRTGIPFNDPSGDRLREWMGIGRETFHDASRIAIIPMGFCFPGYDAKGGDLPPRRECAANWHGSLFAAMPQIELKLLVGRYAQAWHLGTAQRRTLTETVAAWRDYLDGAPAGQAAIPLPHPSWRNNGWIRKNPWFEKELLPVLRKRIQLFLG